MNTHTLRNLQNTLLLLSLVNLLGLGIALRTFTVQPTTLTGMLAVRAIISGCHTAQAVGITGTLRVSLVTDDDGHIRLAVVPSYQTAPISMPSVGTIRPIMVERNLTLVDTPQCFTVRSLHTGPECLSPVSIFRVKCHILHALNNCYVDTM